MPERTGDRVPFNEITAISDAIARVRGRSGEKDVE